MYKVNDIEYSTKEEALNSFQKITDRLTFNCERCGKEHTVLKKHFTEFLCTDCKRKQNNLKKYGIENISQLEEIKEKKKQNTLKKYGAENIAQLKEVQDRIKQTNLEKYGVENQMQLKEIQDRIKQTNLEKYGVDNPFKNKEKIQKIVNEKSLEKYGTQWPSQSQEVKNKIKQTNLEKYGVDNPFKIKKNKEAIAKIRKEKNYYNLVNRISDSFEIITTLNEYYTIDCLETPIKLKCKACNTVFDFFVIDGHFPYCSKCLNSSIGGSFSEDEVADYIASIYTGKIERNKRIFLDNKYEIDIYLPELKIGFEYDGIAWHSENFGNKDKNYHLNKQNYAASKGIQLYFIRSNEWSEKKSIVKSIINAKLHYNVNKIFARKCIVKEIDNFESENFLNKNHIQGNGKASIKIGLYYNNELVSVITLAKARFNKNYEYELIRFANKLNTSVIGGFNKMISYFIKKYNPKSIITYSDKRLFNGDIYKNAGFTYLYDSAPNYVYVKDKAIAGSRIEFQKHKLRNKLDNFNENLTESENMFNNGYDKLWDCGNKVYVLTNNSL